MNNKIRRTGRGALLDNVTSMLAYVFWHQPRGGIDASEYERRLRTFHTELGGMSATFRVAPLPFTSEPGYEDWYLVDDWSALGTLNAMAVGGELRAPHDSAAKLAGVGWGGVYGLVQGPARPPLTARWASKPAAETYPAFIDSLRGATVWQRQMVLGPAPEFCVVSDEEVGGRPDSPSRSVIHSMTGRRGGRSQTGRAAASSGTSAPTHPRGDLLLDLRA